MRALAAILVLCTALGADAARKKRAPPDPRTQGLGHSCESTSGCRKHQRCLKTADMNGKPEKVGFCVLPCGALDAGTTKVVEGAPLDPNARADTKKKIPPRCPEHFQCHGADAATPIDLCVKD